jgi:hypothetical protein
MSIIRRWLGLGPVFDDEPFQEQREAVQPFFAMFGMPCPFDDCDEIIGASGIFGLVPTNPIPVNSPRGGLFYLNRLRTRTGARLFFHRLGSTASPIEPSHRIDLYEAVGTDASAWFLFFLCPYHVRRSQQVPDGFRRDSWNRKSAMERLFISMPFFGVNTWVSDFPLGIPDTVQESLTHQLLGVQLPPDAVKRVSSVAAEASLKLLEKNGGRRQRPPEHARRVEDLSRTLVGRTETV